MKVGSNRAVLAFGFLSSVLVGLFAVSSGSLWVDEFSTWLLTRADSIPEWWRRFQAWDSDSQSPLYHFYMYAWAKLFDTHAFALRAANVVIFAIANLALLWPFRSRPAIALPLILASCMSAAIWYYLNEARPYVMFYMGASLMFSATIGILGSREKPSPLAIAALCVGAVLASGASVLGIAWAGSTVLFILIYWLAIRHGSLSDLVKGHYLALAITALCILAIMIHDLRMFGRGAVPVQIHESNILTLLFSFYTNLGLLGVGPGMLDLRANGVVALGPFVAVVVFSTIVLGLVAIAGLFEIRTVLGNRTMVLLVGCILLPVVFTFALGVVVHWRALPRHFMPLIPLFSLLYAFGLAWWWRRRLAGKTVVLIAAFIMAYSSLSVRYAPRHAKDDYKHAAALAATELARDGRVWWAAAIAGALYYDLPYVIDQFDGPQAQKRVQIANDKTLSFLSAQEPPTLVLVSRPETYDQKNAVRDYLSANKYRLVESFPAFTAWRR